MEGYSRYHNRSGVRRRSLQFVLMISLLLLLLLLLLLFLFLLSSRFPSALSSTAPRSLYPSLAHPRVRVSSLHLSLFSVV